MKRTSPHRLFWRIYLNNLVLLLAIAIAVAAIGAAFGRGSPYRGFRHRLAGWIASEAAPLVGDPPALQAHLDSVSEGLGVELSVYRGGQIIATTIEPPLVPDRTARGVAVAPLGDATLVTRPVQFQRALLRPFAVLAAVLCLLALASFPLARSIAAPLEHLTATVRAFGRGDLGARARISRRDQVGELGHSFDEMAARIERLLRSERELLANISHELRTPLSRIRVALELAEEGEPQAARRYLPGIGQDLGELEALVEGVIAAARLDLAASAGEGIPPLRLQLHEAAELIEQSAARFAALHPGRELRVEAPAILPPLRVDETLLRRAIGNLLDNAAKYSAGPVTLRAYAEGGQLAIEVEDRGVGIAPADLPKLFEPFYRADPSRARTSGGVGLGLLLSRRIVEAHGGAIVVESTLGEKTRFTIRIPTATSAERLG
jgi:signal transduction histidine kinase